MFSPLRGSAASPKLSWADMSDHTDEELELESMHPSHGEKQQQMLPPAEQHQGMRRVPSGSDQACSTPSTTEPSSPRTLQGTPNSMHADPLRTMSPYGGFSPQQQQTEEKYAVTIKGLPNELCNEACMNAVLQQAGLSSHVKEYEACMGTKLGEATVKVSGYQAAMRCYDHFSKCVWSTGALAVTMMMLQGYGSCPVSPMLLSQPMPSPSMPSSPFIMPSSPPFGYKSAVHTKWGDAPRLKGQYRHRARTQ